MSWLWIIPVAACLALAAYWAARHGFGQPSGPPRGLAAATLAWAWITIGMELLGTLGLLHRPALALWVGLGFLIGLGCFAARWRSETPPLRVAEPDRWGFSAILSACLVLATSAIWFARSWSEPVKVISDGPIYHLYFAARWWKAGRLFLVATPFGENAAPYFPAGGDLWFSWLMILADGERLAKVGQAPFLLLGALAAYALACRLGSGRSAAVVATSWFVTSTPFFVFSFEPNVDTIFVAGYLVAAYFFLRYGLGDGGGESLSLGALAAGCAWGAKTTGTVFLPVLFVMAIVFIARRAMSIREKFAHLAILTGLPLTTAGYWFARNARLTGNPLYPLQVSLFGRILLPGWYESSVMQLSPYYIPPTDWRSLVDMMMAVLDPRLAPFWMAAVLGVWTVARSRRSVDCWVWLCSLLVVLNIGLYWLLIPYRTQQRFMFQAVGLAVIPLGRLLDGSRWLRGAGVVLLALHLFSPQPWPWGRDRTPAPWDLSPLVPNSFPGLIAWSDWRILTGPAEPLVYPAFRDYYLGWRALDRLAGPQGGRIAYAGTNLPYYLMGQGMRNEVRYVNIDAHPDWLLHDYHAEARRRGEGNWPHPRPGWDRVHPDFGAWLHNLRREKIRFLVVAPANPSEGIHNIADSENFPIERRWADLHPELFALRYRDPRFRIYELENSERPATE